jgi:hypothetical protein
MCMSNLNLAWQAHQIPSPSYRRSLYKQMTLRQRLIHTKILFCIGGKISIFNTYWQVSSDMQLTGILSSDPLYKYRFSQYNLLLWEERQWQGIEKTSQYWNDFYYWVFQLVQNNYLESWLWLRGYLYSVSIIKYFNCPLNHLALWRQHSLSETNYLAINAYTECLPWVL